MKKKECKGCFKEFEKSELIKGVCGKCIERNVFSMRMGMGTFCFTSDADRSIFYAKTIDAEIWYRNYDFILTIKKRGE